MENFKITKREILASISIVAIMLLIGFLIGGKISEHQMDNNEKYNKAVKVETKDLFESTSHAKKILNDKESIPKNGA